MPNVFAIPIFFIVFRETVETGIVISVLLSFVTQQLSPAQDVVLYKKLRKQVGAPPAPAYRVSCHKSHHLPFPVARSGQAPSPASSSASSSVAASSAPSTASARTTGTGSS